MTTDPGALCAHRFEDEDEQCPMLVVPGSRYCEDHADDEDAEPAAIEAEMQAALRSLKEAQGGLGAAGGVLGEAYLDVSRLYGPPTGAAERTA